MLEKIITGAAGAVAAVLIISALTKFTDWISVLFEPAVPGGAVVAFLYPCKEVDGWEDYADGAGKFLSVPAKACCGLKGHTSRR